MYSKPSTSRDTTVFESASIECPRVLESELNEYPTINKNVETVKTVNTSNTNTVNEPFSVQLSNCNNCSVTINITPK